MAIVNYRTPYIGKGHWTIPVSLLTDPPFMNKVRDLGLALLDKIQCIKTGELDCSIQSTYHSFKIELVVVAAQKRAKEHIPKLDQQIKQAQEDLQTTLKCLDTTTSGEIQQHTLYLQDEIA